MAVEVEDDFAAAREVEVRVAGGGGDVGREGQLSGIVGVGAGVIERGLQGSPGGGADGDGGTVDIAAGGGDVGGDGCIAAHGDAAVVVIVAAESEVVQITAANDAAVSTSGACDGDAGVHHEAVLYGAAVKSASEDDTNIVIACDVGSVDDEVPDGAVGTDDAKETDKVVIGLVDGEVSDGVSVTVERALESFDVATNRPDGDAVHVEVVFQSEELPVVGVARAVVGEGDEVVGGLDEPGAVAGSAAVPCPCGLPRRESRYRQQSGEDLF